MGSYRYIIQFALKLFLMILVIFMAQGCMTTPLVGGIYADYTLPAVSMTQPVMSTIDFDQMEYTDVGPAHGRSSMISFFSLFTIGDAGAGKAFENALYSVKADTLKNVRMDYHGIAVFGIFAKITTIVEGEGIRFASRK